MQFKTPCSDIKELRPQYRAYKCWKFVKDCTADRRDDIRQRNRISFATIETRSTQWYFTNRALIKQLEKREPKNVQAISEGESRTLDEKVNTVYKLFFLPL